MKAIQRYAVLIILVGLLITSRNGTAQEMLFNAFSADSVGVGEPVQLMISVNSSTQPVLGELIIDSLNNFTFYPAVQNNSDSVTTAPADIALIDPGNWTDQNGDGKWTGSEWKWTKTEKDGQSIYRNVLTFMPLNVGIYVFNGLEITVNGQRYQSNASILKVTFKDYNLQVVDSTGLAPIKHIEREGLKIIDLWPLFLILGIIVLSYLGYYFWKKRTDGPEIVTAEQEPEIVLPPDVVALTQLKELRERQLWQKGEIKGYQSELSRIIRAYLEGRYDIKALESTTNEIIQELSLAGFNPEDRGTLTRILQISDLVKFAKVNPDVNIHDQFMEEAIAFVLKTRRIIEENEQEEE